MPDKTIVLKTETTVNRLRTASPDTQVVIEGTAGIDILTKLAKASWKQGRSLEFQCNKLIFKRGA